MRCRGARARLSDRADLRENRGQPCGTIHLADLVAAAAARVPDHPAVVDVTGATTLTWAELDAAGSAEAARLRAHGVGPDDRVAIRLPNGAACCVALLGALRAGAVAVPYGPGAVRRELAIVLADCRPAVLVATAGDATAAAVAADSGWPCSTRRTWRPGPSRAGGPGGGERTALLIYTSGSTGTPRGVRLSHRALLANREQTAALRPAPITPVDRVLLALPLFHTYGLGAGFLQVCWAAATVVLTERLDPEQLAEVIVEQRVSTVAGVPSTFRALLELPAERLRAATAGLRLCTSGGAPLPPRYLAEFRSITGLPIVEGYGLTEAGPVVTSNAIDGRPEAGVGRPPAARDRAAAGGQSTTADGHRQVPTARTDPVLDPATSATTTSTSTDDTGLVAIRGPNLFSGYWPDGAGGPDADGWFRTADVGFLDADGDLHLVDRSSDLVIVNGFNVYPREVEQVLLELPGVAEAAVVGVPDERSGQAVRAVLVRPRLDPADAELTADEVRGALRRAAGPVQGAGHDRVRAGAAAHAHRQGRAPAAGRRGGREVAP